MFLIHIIKSRKSFIVILVLELFMFSKLQDQLQVEYVSNRNVVDSEIIGIPDGTNSRKIPECVKIPENFGYFENPKKILR